jgi:hypothetical protein
MLWNYRYSKRDYTTTKDLTEIVYLWAVSSSELCNYDTSQGCIQCKSQRTQELFSDGDGPGVSI